MTFEQSGPDGSNRTTTTGAGRRIERAHGRREELVSVARALIAERGFEGLRTREVAERVGINHATIHHHFPTKESLIEAVVRDLVSQLDTVRLVSAYDELPPAKAFERHLEVARLQMLADPQLYVALGEFFLRAKRDLTLEPIMRSVVDEWTGYLRGLLQRGVEEGAFRPDLDPSAAASVVVCFFRGVELPARDGGESLRSAIAQLEHWIMGAER